MDKIAAALVRAQKAFGPALKTHTNPAFKSRYADLSACIEAVVDALNGAGIMLMQRNIQCETGITVETVFIHESGEQISSGPLHVPASKQDPQGYGSALTYARRYSLMAACGIAPEDDDGNAASRRKTIDHSARNTERADWLASQKDAIFSAKTSGELKEVVARAVDMARSEDDTAAVDLLKGWAQGKIQQAKTKEAA